MYQRTFWSNLDKEKELRQKYLKTLETNLTKLRCLPTCPEGLDILTLMRNHMYAVYYPKFYQARCTLREISIGKGLDTCVSCDSCKAKCIRHVDIASRIAELKAIYA